MLYIEKNKVPEFLRKFTDKYPNAGYDNIEFKQFIRPLRENLVKEQRGLCAYCCSKISVESSHNEHIEPRHNQGLLSRRSLDYTNIIASCNAPETCGNHKGKKYDEKRFVAPVNKDCADKFSYDPDGYIKGDEYTISLLNLNSYRLRKARRGVYKVISGMTENDIRMSYCANNEEYFPYSNVIFWFLKNVSNKTDNENGL